MVASSSNSKNVGILGMQVYTPKTYVAQSNLEEHYGVASGKYTIGLGQQGLALTGDAEDINSICLTVTQALLETYTIDPSSIGRLEVGTETLVDKSKSTKTVLMGYLFPNHHTDVEGATIVNACYGGTAALLNAFLWCESDGWNGQYAVVVAADIATYARGPARPTSGVGAVALLIGRDAPLSFDPRLRTTHAAHVWDFFKPDPSVEYPVVNGAESQVCYYRALEDVYTRFVDKMNQAKSSMESFTATTPDYYCFHAPYNKLVQKSFARLFFLDARREYESTGTVETKSVTDADAAINKEEEEKKSEGQMLLNSGHATAAVETCSALQEWLSKPMEDTYNDRALDGLLKTLSASAYKQKLADANYASQHIGNTYTASVFVGLASLVDRVALQEKQQIVMFSYGSGALASMYLLQVREPTQQTKFTISKMKECLNLTDRLEKQRERVHPSELDHALETRARMHRAGAPYSPVYPSSRLFPGTYYINGMDASWRRTYSRVPLEPASDSAVGTVAPGSFLPLAPPIVLRLAKRDALSQPVTGKLQVLERVASDDNRKLVRTSSNSARMASVITGTAAGLPGVAQVFGKDNFNRLIAGEQCIAPISHECKMAMVEKNVVQLMKEKGAGGTTMTKRSPVDSEDKVIQLAAQLGSFDLSQSYGVPPGLAQTMDLAAQVAVAAGMEALKDAGLVSGKSNAAHEWMLPEQYRDCTGVVYASSFPAMDAAVGEVMRFLKSKTVDSADSMRLLMALRSRLVKASPDQSLTEEDEAAFSRLAAQAQHLQSSETTKPYEFDRKFLFRVLVLGNAQLAQLAGCRGPNTQTNAACAGTTQAIAMAQDMLISGRAQRVVVIAGDNASGGTLLPWLGSGFRALGAATTKAAVEDAACPFDKRRSGLLLGAGGIGMVLETEASSIERKMAHNNFQVKARLLHTQYSNSAFHGAALDRKHIGSELVRFLAEVELVHGICKAEIATHGVYFSHETSTHASDASSCSGNEVAALRFAFGDDLLSKMLILNTKGFTGHPMGVSFEDVTAVEVLLRQQVPPVPNYSEKDDYLGNLKISAGGPYACRYALRFAAGFGSQVAFALYATAQFE